MVFAFGPLLLTTITAVLAGFRLPIADAAPLLLLSGLAVVVFAGDTIQLHHQRLLGLAWPALLVAPAVLMPLAIVVLPWATGTELKVAQPATAMGTFFADSFARRTGRPLEIVGGDQRIAELVSVGAPGRPNVYFDTNPAPRSRITAEAVRAQRRSDRLAELRYQSGAAAGHQGALSRPGSRGAACFRPTGARSAAAAPDRLGRDQAGRCHRRHAVDLANSVCRREHDPESGHRVFRKDHALT